MTGFGRGTAERPGLNITVEMSAVNHRFCEVVVKAPSSVLAADRPLRQLVQQRLERGRVTVTVQVDRSRANGGVQLDEDLARAYVDRLRAFGAAHGLEDDLSLSDVLRIGSLWDVARDDRPEEELVECTLEAAGAALDALEAMRRTEGDTLYADLLQRLDDLERMMVEVEARAPSVPTEYRERLLARVEQLRGGIEVDEQRVAAEVMLYAEKSDITEEIVRYHSHLAQCRELAASGEPTGRRLDFLCQELNRETNTIASKARDERIGRLTVEMKAQLEKVREQVQNVE